MIIVMYTILCLLLYILYFVTLLERLINTLLTKQDQFFSTILKSEI